jgi:hypothetical protein
MAVEARRHAEWRGERLSDRWRRWDVDAFVRGVSDAS